VRSIRPLITAALKVAAVLLIGFVVFRVVVPNHELKTVNSGSSAIETCQLSDGSVLFLNSASRVKFPEKFGKSSREVYFWGEAFFEIAHDQSRPFVIEAGETRIRVPGTSFDVKAYPTANTIEVTVNTGKVLFYHVDKNDQVLGEVTLIKGERGIYDRLKSRISKMSNDDLNYLSWKTGILHFEETPLSVVLNDISEKYNVSFNCSDADIAGYKLTATFDNESLDSVLEVLKLTHHLTFKHNGQGYLVQKAG
jgi:ferric-dicitrate binding protein FerR (iron transport regulator)